jgi:cell division protein ZapA (FtsZ GTPase activity inhibitor)
VAGTRRVYSEATSDVSPRRKRRAVTVQIAGKHYGIVSDADEAWLQHVATRVDEAMVLVRDRTETVDSLDVAVLTALNLARELMLLREQLGLLPAERGQNAAAGFDPARLQDLIALAEGALVPPPAEAPRSRA